MRAACHVGEGLVDGDPLDRGGEIAQDGDGGIAEPLVLVEMSADKNESRGPTLSPARDPFGQGFSFRSPNQMANRLAKRNCREIMRLENPPIPAGVLLKQELFRRRPILWWNMAREDRHTCPRLWHHGGELAVTKGPGDCERSCNWPGLKQPDETAR